VISFWSVAPGRTQVHVRPPAGVVVISIIDDDGSAPALLIAITIS